MSSKTCLRKKNNKKDSLIKVRLAYRLLLVHNTNSFFPAGGSFFNKTKRACKVKLEYLGPIGP